MQIRLRACNKIHVCSDVEPLYNVDEKLALIEVGILCYCFAFDDAMPMPKSRTLRIPWVVVKAPAFFRKVVKVLS